MFRHTREVLSVKTVVDSNQYKICFLLSITNDCPSDILCLMSYLRNKSGPYLEINGVYSSFKTS